MAAAIHCEIRDGIAIVTLDDPGNKVNILNRSLLTELEQVAKRLTAQSHMTGAVVLSAKPKGFIAGADIDEIQRVYEPRQGTVLAKEGQRILGLWADLPFPVIAAIHGHCLGGGAEFALACHYRLVAPGATLALPEVRLGLFPGFGGTQRLPRLIGLERSLGIILTGRNVSSEEAVKIGFADRVAPLDQLEGRACALVREAALNPAPLLAERKANRGKLRAWLLEKNPLGRAFVFYQAKNTTRRRTKGHYPAPLMALEVIKKSFGRSLEEGLNLEASEIGKIVVTPTCKNLIHVFHLSQRPKKELGEKTAAREVSRAAVLGAGVMGSGIAHLFAARGIPVILKDLEVSVVEKGRARIRDLLQKEAVKKGKDPNFVAKKLDLISGATDFAHFEQVDLVVEAVLEKLDVKQEVLREAEEHLGSEAIFATNTSALSVSELQEAGSRPERVGGLHFFNPVHKMPLVEVVRGEKTSEQTAAFLFHATSQLGKIPIVTADRPGFLVNRILVAYLNEACLLAESGVAWHSLEKPALDFGLPMGPFRLIDEVGIDIAMEVGRTLCGAFSYLEESTILGRAEVSGLLGRKGGKGFYLYQNGKDEGVNPELKNLLGLTEKRQSNPRDWRRLLLLMVNEAARCLEEKVVAEPADVDTGLVFGTGFPPFRGGLCRWADAEGLPSLVRELASLSKEIGARYVPSGYLKGRGKFYQ